MKNKKNLIRAAALILTVIMLTVSMSSCMLFDYEFDFDSFFGDELDTFPDDGKEPQLPDILRPNGGTTPPQENEDVDFYPSTGDASNATGLSRTLLSTVIVASKMGNSYSYGAGVVYKLNKEKGDAYIITNYHVLFDADSGLSDEITLFAYGMELSQYSIPAMFVGGSVTYDIAVLKVSNNEIVRNSHLCEIILGDSESVDVFDTVYTVGNPEAQGIAACQGIISVVSEYIDIKGADESMIELRVMRIDAAVNSGNSGGGLYDADGKLIGIVCAKRVGSDVDDIGYAIPSVLAINLADNIIDNCNGINNTQVKRVLLGIEITSKITGLTIDPETGDIDRVSIVEINQVFETSPLLGMLQAGDRITSVSINGKAITPTQIYHVTDYMMTARVGDVVITTVERDGETLSFTITVAENNISLVK